MTQNEVRGAFRWCDLGIDQLLIGWYGNVSIELMALEKPVVCWIKPEWRRNDCPLLQAGVDGLADRLQQIIERRDEWREIGLRGRAYVERFHDVQRVASYLMEIYE